MGQNKWLVIGALLAMFGVMLGAFGAHALKPILEANARIDTFDTAVKYHFYHALGLIIIGVLEKYFVEEKSLQYAGWLMLMGVLVFSGSLYILCITNLTFLGAITPLGGVAMIASWALVAFAVWKNK
jgi:uncharacterized membrane protein YgdD (TMEM256/DUF423 family)